MPPRYAYWTILIDDKPTAFRARERDELLPTFNQLRRKNSNVVLKWFGRGRLWESPEAERAAQRAPKPAPEKRGHEWRPGGQHRDPRDRFKKGAKGGRDRPNRHEGAQPSGRAGKDQRSAPRPARAGGSGRQDRPAFTRPAKPERRPPWRDRPGDANRKPFVPRGKAAQGPRPLPPKAPERRDAEPPPKRSQDSPDRPPPSEQIATKPKPPERG